MLLLRRVLNKFSSAKDTCLKQLHLENGGKIVEFAGTPRSSQDTTCLCSTPAKESSRSTFIAENMPPSLMSVTWVRSWLLVQTELNCFSGQALALPQVSLLLSRTKQGWNGRMLSNNVPERTSWDHRRRYRLQSRAIAISPSSCQRSQQIYCGRSPQPNHSTLKVQCQVGPSWGLWTYRFPRAQECSYSATIHSKSQPCRCPLHDSIQSSVSRTTVHNYSIGLHRGGRLRA